MKDWDQGASMLKFWWGPSPGLQISDFSFYPHMVESRKGKETPSWLSMDINPICKYLHPHDLSYPNYLSRSHLLIPSYLVSIVSTYDLEVGRPQYSVHNEANMKSFCSCCWPPHPACYTPTLQMTSFAIANKTSLFNVPQDLFPTSLTAFILELNLSFCCLDIFSLTFKNPA